MFKKNRVILIEGWAQFEDQETISVKGKKYNAKNFVIATGSESSTINNIELDEKVIVSSTGALELKKIPKLEDFLHSIWPHLKSIRLYI